MDWKKEYPKILFSIFLVFWLITAINPVDRGAWAVENILTVIFLGLLALTYKKFRFSNLSYTLFFLLAVLHVIGSYYVYSYVPLFDLIRDSMGLSRNHYDRVVHFLFGLLFFIPGYEFVSKKLKVRGFWGYFLVFLAITAFKGAYEVIELGYVMVKGINLGIDFLGMQGDSWDAQKDIFLGMLGAAIAWAGMLLRGKK